MMKNYYLKILMVFCSACLVIILPATLPAQQVKKKDTRDTAIKNKNLCSNNERSKFGVECKARYFLGEIPTVKFSITNTERSIKKVKEAEHQKFDIKMTGIFQNDSNQQTKNINYDGSWDIPKEPTKFPEKGERQDWIPLQKREPKYINLSSGESTNLELDLAKTFESHLGVGNYKLTVKSEEGQKVDKEFEVYFDAEKSVSVLAKMLRSESNDVTERNWAVYNLSKFSRTKFVALLEELLKSGTQKQRDFASGSLADLKAGRL